jgi:D-alanyl-lipoteichoic acid acyltransferase DltB (MBOAT superfamily)
VDIAAFFSIHLTPVTLNLLLPVGISFYTFQTLSYVIDVYYGRVQAERHFGIYATFISFFPQLVAGPIERTSNLLPQINREKKFDYDLAIYGARQMLWGFFKKIAVADVVSVYVDQVYDNLQACTGFDLLLAIFFFTIQIYCDFSGYSDIAIGVAKLLGVNLMKNFASPYFALSVKEFWSRWHISLSTWFRDYVYIPLGGNRCSKVKNYMNLMVTFLVSGLWHGANWTFVIWGGIHGAAQVFEKAVGLDKPKYNKVNSVISWAFVFLFCNLAWVFFRADSIQDAVFVIFHVFAGITNIKTFFHTGIGIGRQTLLYIGVLIFIVAAYDFCSLKEDVIEKMKGSNAVVRLSIEYAIVLCIVYAMLGSTGNNSFVYFQF